MIQTAGFRETSYQSSNDRIIIGAKLILRFGHSTDELNRDRNHKIELLAIDSQYKAFEVDYSSG